MPTKNKNSKRWTKRIILSILFSLALVVTAPSIANHVAVTSQTHATQHTAYADGAAAGATPANSTNAEQNAETMTRLNRLIEIQNFFNRLLWPVLYMIGGLMDNSLLFGGGMSENLRDLWVPIRNIVNIFFVIGLVGIALYNITGLGEDGGNYAIKSILPKLIVGIIAVNFSFLGIKVALDVVNVLTTAIFALPSQVNATAVLDDTTPQGQGTIEQLCLSVADVTQQEAGPRDNPTLGTDELNERAKTKAFQRIAQKYGVKFKPTDSFGYIKIQGERTSASPEDIANGAVILSPEKREAFTKETDGYDAGKTCDGRVLATAGKIYFDKFKSSNVAFAMALNMTHFQMIPQQDLTVLAGVGGENAINNLGKLVIGMLFGVVMYILFAASFVALLIVLLARVVVMWLSIVMSPILIVAMAVPSVKEQLGAVGKISEHFVKHLIVPIPIALSLSVGWIMLNVIKNQNLNAVLASGTDLSLGIPVIGMSTLQELIVAVGCVAVIWMGVFTSAEGTIAAGAVGWIGEKLKAAGTFIARVPVEHIPWIPIGGTNYALGSVKTFVNALEQKVNEPKKDLLERFGKDFGIDTYTSSADLVKAQTGEAYIATLRSLIEKVKDGKLTPEELKRSDAAMRDLQSNPKYTKFNELLKKYEAETDEKKRKVIGQDIDKLLRTDPELSKIKASNETAATPEAPATPADEKGKKPGDKKKEAPPAPVKFEAGFITDVPTRTGKLFVEGKSGKMTMVSGEFVYEVNTDGQMRKLQGAEKTQNASARGTEVGKLDKGKVEITMSEADIQKNIEQQGKDSLTKLQKAITDKEAPAPGGATPTTP
ncbi:MAG: hypothetical protein WC285_02850 [Candidatus Gracilibacteria bacterium]|jgi:hypothetical protein